MQHSRYIRMNNDEAHIILVLTKISLNIEDKPEWHSTRSPQVIIKDIPFCKDLTLHFPKEYLFEY